MSPRSSRVRSFLFPTSVAVAPISAALLLFGATGCSLGQGTGDVKTDMLFARECWGSNDAGANGQPQGDPYDLKPDFFAAIPYRDAMLIRVQRGTDVQEVSDGIAVLVDDVPRVRAALKNPPAGGAPIGSPVTCAPTPVDSGGLGSDGGSGASGSDDCPPGTVAFRSPFRWASCRPARPRCLLRTSSTSRPSCTCRSTSSARATTPTWRSTR